jgi:hypothetical protein
MPPPTRLTLEVHLLTTLPDRLPGLLREVIGPVELLETETVRLELYGIDGPAKHAIGNLTLPGPGTHVVLLQLGALLLGE